MCYEILICQMIADANFFEGWWFWFIFNNIPQESMSAVISPYSRQGLYVVYKTEHNLTINSNGILFTKMKIKSFLSVLVNNFILKYKTAVYLVLTFSPNNLLNLLKDFLLYHWIDSTTTEMPNDLDYLLRVMQGWCLINSGWNVHASYILEVSFCMKFFVSLWGNMAFVSIKKPTQYLIYITWLYFSKGRNIIRGVSARKNAK